MFMDLQKEDTCTMSDIELKCIQFWVCNPILHIIYITEYWKITKQFKKRFIDYEIMKNMNNIHPWGH